MSSTVRNTVAILAIVAGLGGAALAQGTSGTPSEQPQATSPANPADAVEITAETLPDALKALNLQDIEIDQERRHVSVEGRLADGTGIEARLDPSGELRVIEADDDAALPASVVETLVPGSVRGTDIFAQFSTIEGVALPPAGSPMAGVMIMGVDADGEKLRAAFAEDGTLTRFGRGEDMKRDGRRGGDHGKGDRKGHRGDRMQGAEHGKQMRGGEAPAQLDEAAVTTILTDGGYDDLGAISRDGWRIVVDAVNAAGEEVTVVLNPRGEVIRETAR